MNTKRLSTLSVYLIVLALLLAACAAPTSQAHYAEVEGLARSGEASEPVPVEEAPAAEAPGTLPGDTAAISYPISGERMVIKDAEMELLVADTDSAIARVTQMAADYGGYVISSQSWFSGDYKYATLRLGVPADTFEVSLNFLRGIGLQVLKEAASGQDVTAEYTDLASRLSNLEATAARVRSFLDEAQTVEESLQINQTLSELEGEIEQVKGQMAYYEGRAAFSTITVTLTPQVPTPTPMPTPTPTPVPGWNPGKTLDQASDVLIRLSQGLVDLLIWLLVVFGPFVLIGGLLLWGGWMIVRRLRKK